jgi:hypothetical protein
MSLEAGPKMSEKLKKKQFISPQLLFKVFTLFLLNNISIFLEPPRKIILLMAFPITISSGMLPFWQQY